MKSCLLHVLKLTTKVYRGDSEFESCEGVREREFLFFTPFINLRQVSLSSPSALRLYSRVNKADILFSVRIGDNG